MNSLFAKQLIILTGEEVIMKSTTDRTTTGECTENDRMDKAFEQILEIAFGAGLLVFMTDEDNSYTQRVLIERPIEDESEEVTKQIAIEHRGRTNPY